VTAPLPARAALRLSSPDPIPLPFSRGWTTVTVVAARVNRWSGSAARTIGRLHRGKASRRFGVRLGAIAGGAALIRVVYVLTAVRGDEPVGDARTYVLLARGLAHGEGYVRPRDLITTGAHVPTAEFPPLWPAVLSVPERLGITSATGLRSVGAVIGALTVVVIGLLGRRVATPTVGLAAAALAGVSPYLVSFDGSLQAEGLYALAVAACLLLLATAVDDGPDRLRWWIAAGVVVGLAALTRTEALLLVPIVVVPVARAGVDGPRWSVRVGVVTAGVVVLLGVWAVRNAVQLDTFQPLTNNSGTLVAGSNCARVYAGYQIGLWRLDCASEIDVTGLSETERAARFRRVGFDYARDHAGRVPVVVAARVARTWGAWDLSRQVDYESLEGRPKPWIAASWVTGWFVVVLAAIGVVAQHRARRPVWLLVGPVVVATLTAVIGYGISRFRMVAEPGLIVLAAVGVVAVARSLIPARAEAV
jgi:4-amino-4-deoxy-L-arabinose transferase-like glycosyltransferase